MLKISGVAIYFLLHTFAGLSCYAVDSMSAEPESLRAATADLISIKSYSSNEKV